MNKKTSIIRKLIYLALALLILAAVGLKLVKNKQSSSQLVYQYDREEPIAVQVDTVRLEKVSDQLEYSGTYEPFRETKLSAEVQGKINEVLVNLGSRVREGQALIHLDKALLTLQLQAVEVQILGLEADVRRYSVLVEAGAIQGVQLEKAQLGLQSAQVQRATLLEQINKTTIRAPFGGVVTAKFIEVGAFAAPGVPLLQISDIEQLKFSINVSENALTQFVMDKGYSITPDAYPLAGQLGKAVLVSSKANMGSSFSVQFVVNNTPDLLIKSGMFGKVVLDLDMDEMGMTIPTSALMGTAVLPQVYVVREGKAVLQQVSVGHALRDRVVVTLGLHPGDLLVTSGFINLFNGANVAIN